MGFKIYGVISTTQNLELYISVSIFNVRFWSCEAPPPCYNVPHSLSKIYFCLLVHDSSSFFIHPCPLLSFQFYCFAFWVLLFLCSFLPAFCCVVNVILMLLVVFYLLTVCWSCSSEELKFIFCCVDCVEVLLLGWIGFKGCSSSCICSGLRVVEKTVMKIERKAVTDRCLSKIFLWR